tara:strand:- start:4058 stop:4306 length:249 start_codon:yes stop_codon:yes gene_type:complete
MEKLQQDLLKNSKKLIFGSDRNLKLLKNDKLERLYLAKNCDEDVKEEVKRFKAEIIDLDVVNSELGVICKKPFSISMIGLSK